MANTTSNTTTLHLALQGGGAHGAFTWGVLDRLLDDPSITIGRISGASAGALKGAALVCGYTAGGRAGAKRNLALLWQKACEAGSVMAWFHLPLRKPGLGVWDDAMPLVSPYQASPLALEHLRYVVSTVADFERVDPGAGPQLYVNAINVNTGRTRIFTPADMSVSAVMASACAPFMFPAVTIDGDAYWDGSYGGNPCLAPLVEAGAEADLLMVELTPQRRAETPMTAKNILNRINELASVSALRADLRHVQHLNETGRADIRLHVLSLPESLDDLEAEPSTKRTVGPWLFESLRQKGYAACEDWLSRNRASLGRVSSVDIAERYLQT
jgi:NTE family protein